MNEAELEIATADKTRVKKKLNPRQAKFVKLYTGGGMSRAQAYSKAYGQKNLDTARKTASELITTNHGVKAAIDEINEANLAAVKERLFAEAGKTLEKYLFLRDGGNKEYGVQFQVCKDHFDRIGLKPVEQVEMSGGMENTVSFNFGGKVTEDDL